MNEYRLLSTDLPMVYLQGLGIAWKLGIQVSRGELVFLCDDDASIFVSKLEKMETTLREKTQTTKDHSDVQHKSFVAFGCASEKSSKLTTMQKSLRAFHSYCLYCLLGLRGHKALGECPSLVDCLMNRILSIGLVIVGAAAF